MARIDKGSLTKREIIEEASRQFLEKGFTHTSLAAIAKELSMSTGNLTFHYPTKEHLLAELTDMLCRFHWKQMEREADEGVSSIMAICLEVTAMAGACEDDPVIKDFLLSAYSSPLCLAEIRRNDTARAMEVFRAYRPDWTEEKFVSAEILVSGIEYATLMDAGDPVSFELRVSNALSCILGIYGVPEEQAQEKLRKVFAIDYRNIGKQAIADFKQFVQESNDQAFHALLKR